MADTDKLAEQQRQLAELMGPGEANPPDPAPVAETDSEGESDSNTRSRAAWERVLLARHSDRPHAVDYIERMFDAFDPIHGDRCFGDDRSITSGFASFRGKPVMVIGQEKGRDTKGRSLCSSSEYARRASWAIMARVPRAGSTRDRSTPPR